MILKPQERKKLLEWYGASSQLALGFSILLSRLGKPGLFMAVLWLIGKLWATWRYR